MYYEKNKKSTTNLLSKKLFEIILEKESNLSVSLDETKSADFLRLAGIVGPYICMLKTHIDIIEDFTPDFIKELKELSKKHSFLIFEDRKFADIGNTSKMQYEKGVYRIAEWADIVNAHTVPGPGVIEGLVEIMKTQSEPRGLIVLAQMTPEGTLAEGEYTQKSVAMCEKYKEFVMGFIASSQPDEIIKLRELAGDDYVFLSPGVKLESGKDSLGQRYSTPEDVVNAGSDVIIVGRGVYLAENPALSAEKYRKAGWEAAKQKNHSF